MMCKRIIAKILNHVEGRDMLEEPLPKCSCGYCYLYEKEYMGDDS